MGVLRARTGLAFDLPNAAQWEFACRAGHSGSILVGNKIEDSAWVYENWQEDPALAANSPHEVGLRARNDFGLYDMHGGIWEWCLDWYAENITALNGVLNIDPTDGTKLADGVTAGERRVMRGGDYKANASVCRAAYRKDASPAYPGDSQEGGARLCCRAGLK